MNGAGWSIPDAGTESSARAGPPQACDPAAMQIATARDAAGLFAPLLAHQEAESIAIAYLGDGQLLLGTGQAPGAADAVELPIRPIIAEALRLNATALILAHNHPGGDPGPSAADIAATRRLAAAAAAVGVRVHDHLIFAGSECRSLRALGLL